MLPSSFLIRHATLGDLPGLQALIALSARSLMTSDYSDAQIEGALRDAFGVDSQLIRDRSYLVVEHGGQLVGCGGWSRRRTLFGGDARADRDPQELDPRIDAAKIRAFFVHPDYARRGIGAGILDQCEQEAMAQGFSRFELMGTLPGVRLYSARGYVAGDPILWSLGGGLSISFVPMAKQIGAHGAVG